MSTEQVSRLRVSVIIPCYNAGRYVEQTVATVRAQTLTEWEIVLVDDGSTDGTAATLDALADRDPRIGVLKQENQGVCAARNHGAKRARPSDYLLFLDADDLIHPSMLETLTNHLDGHPNAVLAYCGLELIDSNDNPISSTWADRRIAPSGLGYTVLPSTESNTPLASLMSSFAAIPSTCVFRRTAFDRTAGWDPGFVHHGDKDIVILMATLGEVHHVPNKLMRYRQHGTSLSSTVGATRFRWTENAALTEKWWAGRELTAPQRQNMRAAILFDGWLAMLLQARGAAAAAGRGEFQAGCTLLLQAASSGRRFLARYFENVFTRR